MKIQDFSISEDDHCAYYIWFDDGSFIILLLYVDDMLCANPLKKIISRLNLVGQFK